MTEQEFQRAFPIQLNPQQAEAVYQTEGPVLPAGGAGERQDHRSGGPAGLPHPLQGRLP